MEDYKVSTPTEERQNSGWPEPPCSRTSDRTFLSSEGSSVVWRVASVSP